MKCAFQKEFLDTYKNKYNLISNEKLNVRIVGKGSDRGFSAVHFHARYRG